MEQLSFGFPEMAMARRERLFYACLPDGEASLRVYCFAREFLSVNRLTAKPLPAARLHVTLHHVGDYRSSHGLERRGYLSQLAGRGVSMEAFDISFASIGTFEASPSRRGQGPRYPLVLLARRGGVADLHARLGGAMTTRLMSARADFVPHMTLCYLDRPVACRPVEPMDIAIRDFVLIHSRVGLSEYRILARWCLGDGENHPHWPLPRDEGILDDVPAYGVSANEPFRT
ncbi:RNA 2',3'-cyclic phosphodiesterase [Labrys miyagiensis]